MMQTASVIASKVDFPLFRGNTHFLLRRTHAEQSPHRRDQLLWLDGAREECVSAGLESLSTPLARRETWCDVNDRNVPAGWFRA